ncbi:membrane protein insertion efficiency factor YidD [Geomicrobium sp. JCM 19038]|uniref:membrane protein insertion efficiency factor YidD n=1 Tax=Geomicrobium sp. JCM 19038 TaxID=1460635 RepID=UPI00045F26F3|nr:membrane protein insertion efficiency factor YidD [Geomicrobium sp. JCM 19038]GAK06719.1 YidD protein [Geomicrobium sp. JCM 19038]
MLKKIVIAPIRLYQKYISPATPPTCRFQPTCSQYMLDAVLIHGVFKGVSLGVIRILKCHPFHKGGFDPVPPEKKKTSE